VNHFRQIATGIDTSSIRAMLEAHPLIWNGWMDKHETPKIHGVSPRLVGPDMPFWDGIRDGRFREALFIRWFVRDSVALPWSSEPRKPFDCKPPLGETAPWTRDTVNAIADIVKPVEVGAIYLVNVNAGQRIWPHTDGLPNCSRCIALSATECRYARRYPERFHLVITSNPDCWMESGGERVCMLPGELWWFDWRVEHGVTNEGNTDRVHLLFDAVTSNSGRSQ
jgi:Aspartyl/Asparaginyl beta-hydroxylase